MKVLFGSWFLEYCGKVCFGLFGAFFMSLKVTLTEFVCCLGGGLPGDDQYRSDDGKPVRSPL